ncbi:MAG: hypothetical protein ACK5UA_03925, partial [Cereibacter sp.]
MARRPPALVSLCRKAPVTHTAVLCAAALLGLPAAAQERIPSQCIDWAQGVPGVEVIRTASFGAPLAEGMVRISYA